jgi:hypothetical protein
MTWRDEEYDQGESTWKLEASMPETVAELPPGAVVGTVQDFPGISDDLTDGDELMLLARINYLATACLFSWSQQRNQDWKLEWWGTRVLPVAINQAGRVSPAHLVLFLSAGSASDYAVLMWSEGSESFVLVQPLERGPSHFELHQHEAELERRAVTVWNWSQEISKL